MWKKVRAAIQKMKYAVCLVVNGLRLRYTGAKGGVDMPGFWYGGKGAQCRFKVLVSPQGYGIAAQKQEETAALEGIFCSREETCTFARRCARAQLEPCHLRDAVEDWLAQIK